MSMSFLWLKGLLEEDVFVRFPKDSQAVDLPGLPGSLLYSQIPSTKNVLSPCALLWAW